MKTITITNEIAKEIKVEIYKAISNIEKEMAYPSDLRNYESIERNAKYLKEMREALIKGEL